MTSTLISSSTNTAEFLGKLHYSGLGYMIMKIGNPALSFLMAGGNVQVKTSQVNG